MINTDWKEEIVLQFRTLTIDKQVVSSAMQNFVEIFNSNLHKYNINNIKAASDLSEYIEIEGYKKIKIKYYCDNVTFAIYDKDEEEQDVFIRLSIVKEMGLYLIDYINADKMYNANLDKVPHLVPFIDEDIIDGILEDLFELNHGVTMIK